MTQGELVEQFKVGTSALMSIKATLPAAALDKIEQYMATAADAFEKIRAAASACDDSDPVFTIEEFCARNRMSRSKYFDLCKRGLGPRTMLHGRIRLAAETEWRARMEAIAKSEAAQLEHARRVELAKRAGEAAAKSPLHACRHQLGKKRNGKPNSRGSRS